MMPVRPLAAPALAALLLAPLAGAAFVRADPILRDGLYQIDMRLDLPNVATGARKTVTLCLGADDGRGNPGFRALSDNNPLGRCPVSEVKRGGDTLSFLIRCPGANRASAVAVFRIAREGFRGRIEMNMGGKNMTMTEAQEGVRVAACPTGRVPEPDEAAADRAD